ncbi:MAG: ferredoxin [Candidatus Magasanikbacteria bacterium CG_4_9_14_0_2_um_filter_42_11]|uniref:Ferredoxin n=1 Tax=Candidatus Magasanikbacteria bacterium CG_4_9_14_0_2_um_filter_42_11 TaxID=1974643 RepID=A0A2M8F8R7_9BACT|nr:MAG: ferredoxin [Candidatus Magasanikbacteria bacterium CG_4_9_14_0_2_um_filter_42_11]
MPKIIHYRENCIGCDSCVLYAPRYWQIDEDGKSSLTRGTYKDGVGQLDIDEVELPGNTEASMACPVGIIRIQDDSGKNIGRT